MKLSSLGEFGLIRYLARGISLPPRLVGIGDDAAVIPLSKGLALLLTTDMLVAGTHFLPGPFRWIGEKAMRVNVSDIAAMGGRPVAAVVALGVPSSLSVKSVGQLYDGFKRVARLTGLALVGGDTVKTSKLTLAISILGEVKGKPLLRSGARVGDSLYLTGNVGEAALGLLQMRKEGRKKLTSRSVRRYWFPPIRLSVAEKLRHKGVHAMIDVSDGLLADLRRLCEASGVGALLRSEALPPLKSNLLSPTELLRLRLTGGDDYELLLAYRGRLPSSIDGVSVTCIGRICRKEGGLKIVGKSGKIIPFPGTFGYTHF